MNYKISFQERAQKAKEILSRQPGVSLQQMKDQADRLKKRSTQEKMKKKI